MEHRDGRPRIQSYPACRLGSFCAWSCLCLLVSSLIRAEAPDGRGGPISYGFFPIASPWGSPIVRAGLARIRVLENRATGSAREIELAFVRIPSTSERPAAPILWLSGGPGASGTADLGTPVLQLLLELRQLGDVIVLDQRGTGLSVPRLDCPGSVQLPFDVATDRERFLNALERVARPCAESWRSAGVDLSAYNIRESAEDIEDVRRALAVPKIRLLASSWGTHLALAAIRAHENTIERAVLVGVVGPDHLHGSPAAVDDRLAQISRAAGRDLRRRRESPDLFGSIRRIFEKLRREPRVVELQTVDGGHNPIVLGAFDLACYLRTLLSSEETIAHLPAFVAAMEAGDFQELASVVARWRLARPPSASVFAARCASGASPARLSRIERESQDAVLGETRSFAVERVCRAFGVDPLPDSFRSPVQSSVAALFVSGTLDGDTPEENAIEVSRGFSNSERLRVEGAAHALLGFAESATRAAIVRFFEGRRLRETQVAASPVTFERPNDLRAGSALALAVEQNTHRVQSVLFSPGP